MSAVLKPAMRRAWPRPDITAAIYHDFVRDEHAVDGVRQALDQIWTFERDSLVNGWERENRANLLTEFAIDEPAFVIDPATGQPLGYRALAGFTNSLLWSRTLSDAVWDSTGATINQDAIGLKRNANTAWSITGDDVTQDITVTDDSATHTEVAYWRKDADDARLQVQLLGGTTTLDYIADLDVSAGTATAGGDATSSDITVEDVGDFWKVILSATNNGTGNTNKRYGLRPVTLTETAVYDFGGVYLNSSIAGPPIETEGSPVSTAADAATEPLPASCQDGFVWVVHARVPSLAGSSNLYYGAVSDGSTTNSVLVRHTNGGSDITLRVEIAGANFSFNAGVSVSEGDDVKIAMRAQDSKWAISVNGSVPATNTTSGFPNNLTNKDIGQRENAGEQINSTIALDYLDPDPSAWTDADLQAATS